MSKFNGICLLVIVFCIAALSIVLFFGCSQNIKAKHKYPPSIQVEIKESPKVEIQETPPNFEESKQDEVKPLPKPPQRARRK